MIEGMQDKLPYKTVLIVLSNWDKYKHHRRYILLTNAKNPAPISDKNDYWELWANNWIQKININEEKFQDTRKHIAKSNWKYDDDNYKLEIKHMAVLYLREKGYNVIDMTKKGKAKECYNANVKRKLTSFYDRETYSEMDLTIEQEHDILFFSKKKPTKKTETEEDE